MARRRTTPWNPVKTVVKEILNQYHPEAVKAEMIWDHVKTEMPNTQITKETIYGILYHMNKEGEIRRVSTGWYQLKPSPTEPQVTYEVPPDPAWQMGYDEGYKEGYKAAMSPTADLEKMKEKMMQIFFDKLVLEAQKVHPDPRRIQLIVEMMREIMGGCREVTSRE